MRQQTEHGRRRPSLAGALNKFSRARFEIVCFRKLLFDCALDYRANIREPDPPGAQHACEWMEQDCLNANSIRHGACVLTTGAAERD